MGDREKGPADETAKWDFLTLSDFKCTSAWTYFAYGWLWFMTLIGISVYVLDTYTAVNLLVYDHWSSQIQPAVPFKYSKWIFAICILLSWALCVYEWIRAMRVIRRGGVAESFLDPLAVTLQSIRRQGFKRFLVFTELTKSKKGADYVALFVYFAFKGAIRVILAEGPRQAVNAMTLYAVLSADLIPNQSTSRNSFDQFWLNVQSLADSNPEQAVIYCSMLFTLFIWVFSALSLMISGVLYILFLWHYIPQRDGRLSIYCRRKIDKRLAKIVEHKVKAALEKEERKAEKAQRKAEQQRKKTGDLSLPEKPSFKKQPTLPDIGGTPPADKEDKMPDFGLARQNTTSTVATLPPYSSRPNDSVQRLPTLSKLATDGRPGMMRSDTQTTGWSTAPSYSTEAPLLANAGYAGGPAEDIPLQPSAISRQDSYASFGQFHGRADSQSTQGSRRPFTPGPPSRGRSQTPLFAGPYVPNSNNGPAYPPPGPRMPPPVGSNTAFSFDQDSQSAINNISPQDTYNRSFAPPMRSNTADGYRPGLSQQQSDASFTTSQSQRSFSRPMNGRNGSQATFNRPYTPAAPTVPESRPVSEESYEMKPQPTHTLPTEPQSSTYVAFNPSLQSSTPAPAVQQGPQRNITVTGATSTGDYFSSSHLGVPQRSVTAPIGEAPRNSSYAHDILAEYGSDEDESHPKPPPAAVAGPPRSETPQGGAPWRAYRPGA